MSDDENAENALKVGPVPKWVGRSPSLGLGATGTGRDSGADSRPTARSRSLPAASYYLRPVTLCDTISLFFDDISSFL